MLLSLPLLFSLPSVSVCWGSPAGWPSVELQSCSPAVPTAPPEALLTWLQLGPKLQASLVTHWSLCVEAGPRPCPDVRPGFHLNHDAGLFHWSLCAVIVCRWHLCEGFEFHWNLYETEVGPQSTPDELDGSGLLLVHDWKVVMC